MTFQRKVLSLAVAQVIAGSALSLIAASPVFAQSTASPDDATNAPIQRVEITGSNIRRADKETPSPVQVISAEDLKQSGYTSVSDVLKNISANGQGTLSSGNSEAFAGGGNGIALRGLTVGATLVLIDGHRMAPYPLSDDGERQFTDITSIPFDAIDHIDVLKDGASAVYGSDAIAGVVNVVLKKSYTGTSLTAEAGTATEGGGTTEHASIMHGFGNLNDDGYNGYFNIEVRHEDAIRLSQREGQSWTNLNFTGLGGNNLTPGVPTALNGFLPATQSPYLLNPNGNASSASSYAFYPGCNYTSFNNGQCGYYPGNALISPETTNINLLSSFTKKLAGDWEVNVKASLFDSKSEQIVGSSTATSPVFPGASFVGGTNIAPPVNPNTMFNIGAIPSFTVPANYPGNTLGVAAVPYGEIPGFGSPQENFDSKSYRFVADFSGSIGDWDAFASVGITEVTTDVGYENFINLTSLYNALQAPNGSAQQFLLSGGNSQALLNQIGPHFSVTDRDQLDFVEGRASRELFNLPGGGFAVSLGGEFIHKNLNSPAAQQILTGQTYPGTFQVYVDGEQNDGAAFGEFVAPVLKTLEIDGALRFDHFDTYGNSTTPQIKFKWTPTDVVAFRGAYSQGFRAPNAAESGSTGTTFGLGQTVPDPLLCPGGPYNTGTNPPKGTAINQCNVALGYLQTPNPDLQPEKSTSITLGTILEPVKGWSTTIDYYDIKIKDQIVSAAETSDFVPDFLRTAPVAQPIADGNGGSTIGIPTVNGVPTGNIALAFSPYINANTTETTGIELGTTYKFKLGEWGSLRTTYDISHMFTYKLTTGGQTYELAGTHGPNGVSGDTGNPQNRSQLTLAYDRGPLNVTTTFNYTGGYSVIDPSAASNFHTCQSALLTSTADFAGAASAPSQYCHVNGFLDTDLYVGYKVNKQWTVHASVTNLFNQAPPLDFQTYGGGFLPYNPSLAMQGAIGRFVNVGANYKF